MDTLYSTINFYSKLKEKYRDYLKPEIISVAMVQSEDAVYLEILEEEIVEGGLEKQTVRRIDLDFITEDVDEPFFNPGDPIEENVSKFINEFSPYSIINTTDLFHDEACEKISKKYNRFGVDR